MIRNFNDAQQQAAGFVVPQYYNLETTVYQIKYPSFEYADFMPVVTEGNEWARGTMFYSMDEAGQARWMAGGAFDMPLASVSREQFSHAFHMAAIGYEWNLEEIETARIEGRNLGDEKARAARGVSQQFLWNLAMTGKGDGVTSEKGWTGLVNNGSATAADVAADGTGNVTWWAAKTPDLILRDINAAITGIYNTTKETEMADTILLPTAALLDIMGRRLGTVSETTIYDFISRANVYTQTTGNPLMIRGLRALNAADPGGDGRMVTYRRSPDVLRFHLPMPHKFLPPWQKSAMTWEVGGIMRTGGLEVRLPKAIIYSDGIVDT